jgi:ubiquinone/menaquinone biosynthesis C-methylase UbiE
MPATEQQLEVESAVTERYAEAAKKREASLCCPVQYDAKLLEVIPREVIERDYGCGDPSAHVRRGETVLDLGSGSGKICFIASQLVGAEGRVIGVDMTDDMLALARRSAKHVAERIGFENVTFKKGRIQDLALDIEALDAYLRDSPVLRGADVARFEADVARHRAQTPLIADDSVDVVVSNCVLNLVEPRDKVTLFDEIFRVLRRGGRAVISDIVSDQEVPSHLQNDAELWSGCIAGALREQRFLGAFEQAGFAGIEVLERQHEPWRTVENIEFRSVTVLAHKGPQSSSSARKDCSKATRADNAAKGDRCC